jgi:hypothetical protein
MLPLEKLAELSVKDLREELRAREVQQVTKLQHIDTSLLLRTITSFQRSIYGDDDRVEVRQLQNAKDIQDADSVVALFEANDFVDNGNGTSTLKTRRFGEVRRLCESERFREQPAGNCSTGFLIAKNLIATAGHCAPDDAAARKLRCVFGFRMLDDDKAQTVIHNDHIFKVIEHVDGRRNPTTTDWAVLKLDRPVTNHRVAPVRRTGRIGNGAAVHVIGHPLGLPMKFAGNANVRDNSKASFFSANLDTYGGNSGSPVFNSETHEVEGILVRGERDFVQTPEGCFVSLVCPTTGCRGEECTRATEFSALIG